MDLYLRSLKSTVRKIDIFLLKYIHMLQSTFGFYENYIFTDAFYKNARKYTYPLHWTWILWWKFFQKKHQKTNLLYSPGIHILSAPPGLGKTSLVYNTIESKGGRSYINNRFEKVRPYVPDPALGLTYYYKKHTLFTFTDFWRNGKQWSQPDHARYQSIVLDELHQELNYRNNGTKEYNEKFLPFMDYGVIVRHKIGCIYITTQMNKVDVQLMQLATFYEVEIERGFDYQHWKNVSGKFENRILGWRVTAYKPLITPSGGIDLKKLKAFYVPCTADMEYYDTYSMRHAFKNVPIFKGGY